MKCKNCGREITNKDEACYSQHVNEAFCSLEHFTDFAHEYLRCIPIIDKESDVKKEFEGLKR